MNSGSIVSIFGLFMGGNRLRKKELEDGVMPEMSVRDPHNTEELSSKYLGGFLYFSYKRKNKYQDWDTYKIVGSV